MRHRILIPTDFSKNAWHAIKYALELYKHEYCNFYILNVFSASNNIIDSLLNLGPGSELYETAKLESENGLAKVLNMIAFTNYDNQKHHFETISSFNNVVEAIKNSVDEKNINLIIMGTKGKTGSRKIMYGSTAINVMEKVRNCPVIVVPEKAAIKLPKEIVFPTNYKTTLKQEDLRHLIYIAKNCKASIEILHISEKEGLDTKQLSNKKLLHVSFNGVNNAFHKLSTMDIATAINCFAESRGSDMVAFINKKHIFFGSILTHPLVKKLGYNSKIPILVMHDSQN
ncbi:universal stress protein [Algibacter sp. 2305UL17-15]|uniref:universal stress protein n=1 Tax=Algibacter sp. 2305UL17-15 TaxID=3231268 RepID=UPI0034596DF9